MRNELTRSQRDVLKTPLLLLLSLMLVGCGSSPADDPDAALADVTLADAAPPDATPPDAAPLDAALPDAELPDAAPPADASALPDAAQGCTEDATELQGCGDCGQQTRTCTSGSWTPWSGCTGEGVCSVGAVENQSCGTNVGACQEGLQSRTCSAACAWEPWDACGGASYIPAAATDACGDAVDNNCNGVTDENCGCVPVTPGAGGFITFTGTLGPLAASPTTCLLYLIVEGTDSEVVVIDRAARAEIARTTLPDEVDEIAVSRDGSQVVVSHYWSKLITVIDPLTGQITNSVTTLGSPSSLQVTNAGMVFYLGRVQHVTLRKIDLAVGTASDVVARNSAGYYGETAPGADEDHLFVGESGSSGSTVKLYDLTGVPATMVDESTFPAGYGFSHPQRHVYHSPAGHVYYAQHQLLANDLTFTLGATWENVFAADAAGTFAVGTDYLFDAELLQPVAAMPAQVSEAVLTAGDQELWFSSNSNSRLYYQNVSDLLGAAAATLGDRERSPKPLAVYDFRQLVYDAVRGRLYGVDYDWDEVVVIDAATLQPTHSIVVGTSPNKMDIDPTGTYLYVGHQDTQGFARIDLATLTFGDVKQTQRIPYELITTSNGRVVVTNYWGFTRPLLVDGATGALVDDPSTSSSQAVLARTADGNTVFTGGSGHSFCDVRRYDVSAGTMSLVDTSPNYSYPWRYLVPLPDGSAVYFDYDKLDGANLSTVLHSTAEPIVAVTPDGTKATSTTSVYSVATGASLGTFPVGIVSSPVQAIDPTSSTVYVASPGTIQTVDLTTY